MKRRIPLKVQELALKTMFPDSKVIRHYENSICWIDNLIPTPLSNKYKVKLYYSTDLGVRFYILDPHPLLLADGESKLPHVYCQDEQRLCLYFPDGKEWNHGMLFTKTIILWASEWLQHYEIWVGTRKWNGGGIHNSDNI